jgi:LacI family transcriptional regulator
MARRRVTSIEVAKLAGVSQSTVSIVLSGKQGVSISDKTRQRVLEAARQLDYHPNAAARSLVRQESRTLGLLPRDSPDRMKVDAFLPPLIEGITSVASAADFGLLVQPIENPEQPDEYIKLVREGRVDGIVLGGSGFYTWQLPENLFANFPVVLWGQVKGSDLPFVDVDNIGAARVAVEHLIALGHRRIGCITNAPPEQSGSEALDRLRGYRSALTLHALPFDENLVRYGHHDEQSGYAAMQSLLAMPDRPSAVFIASDEVALGALQATRSTGVSVPHELAIVSFDDIPAARHVTPPLTTIRVPIRELGAVLAQMLIAIIQTGNHPASKFLETELVVRESCGAQLKSQEIGAELERTRRIEAED